MGATFQTLWGEIKDSFPNLSPFLAKRFIQRAVEDIYTNHRWSFLTAEGVLFSPLLISSGAFSIVQFSNIITANAAAILALTNLSNPILTKRQIRFNGSGQIYSITDIDANFAVNGLLTLDRPVVDATSTSATYQVYRCYYGLPQTGVNGVETTDFASYNTVYNPAISDWFRGVSLSSDILNKKDPMRTSIGSNPYYLFFYKADSTGSPQFEMWPHPLAQGVYLANYQRKGTVPTLSTDTLPTIIPDNLVLEKAMFYGCLWANKHSSVYDELKGVNWLLLSQVHKKEYSNISSAAPGILEITERQDEEISPQSLIIDDRTYDNFAIGDDSKTGYYSITP